MSLNATIDPTPCKNDCGYWGDQLTEYYCSACYKEHLTKKQEGQQQMKQQQVSTMEVFHESDSHEAQHPEQQQDQQQQHQQTEKNDETNSSSFSVPSAESSADNSPCLNASHSSSSSSSSSSSPSSSSSSSSHVITSGVVAETPPSPGTLLDVASQTLNKELEEHSRKISTPKKSIQCCHVCKKNVRLYGFDCRCGLLLCGVHRYHDKHNCSFDYASSAISELRTSNAKVVADKLKDRI